MPVLNQEWGPIPAIAEFTYNNAVLTPAMPSQVNFQIKDASLVLSELNQYNNPKYSDTSLGCTLRYYGSSIEWINPMCYTNMGYPIHDGVKDFHYDGMTFAYTPLFQDLHLLPVGTHVFTHNFVVYGLTFLGNVWEEASTYTFQTILNVTGTTPPPSGTPTTFTPEALTFNHSKGDTLPTRTINVSGSSWKIEGKPNFVFSSPTPGVLIENNTDGSGTRMQATGTGSAVINVTLGSFYETSDNFGLSDLNTQFKVNDLELATFTMMNVQVTVVKLSDFLVVPYVPNRDAFTLDPLFYEVKTQVPNTYFQLNATVKTYSYLTHEETETLIQQRVVPYRGSGKINLGKVIHRLMHRIGAVNETELQYKKATLSLTCVEKYLTTDTDVRTGTAPLLDFVAGLSRGLANYGFLDFNPLPNRVTQNSFAYLNIWVNEPNCEIRILKNGTEVNTILLPTPNDQIITKKITFKDFTKGDVVETVLAKVGESNPEAPTKRFVVFPDSFYSCHLVWENEFKLQSALECTGTASIKTDFETIEQKLYKNLVEVIETIETSKEVKLTINTGWLLETDVDTVESLLRSRRIWMVKEDKTIALRSKPKSMINRDYERELIEYTFEFTINRAYDEETYTL